MIDKLIITWFISVLFLFAGLDQCIGQDEEYGVIFWSKDRNLEWADFEGKQLIDTLNGYYLDLYVDGFSGEGGFYYGADPFGKLAYVFKKTSYVSEEIRNDDLLRYLNVYFDMAAYYSFKYIMRISEARNSLNPNINKNSHIMSKAVVEEWKVESARLSLETNYGVEIEKLLVWEERVNQLVATINAPVAKYSNSAYGLDLGIGQLIGRNGYKELLTEPLVGLFGGEVMIKPYVFGLGLSGGGQKVKKSFSKGSDDFLQGSEPNLLNIFIHGGYVLLDNQQFKIIPRIGLHFSNLRYPEKDAFDSNVWAFSYTAGATMDFKLKNWDSTNPFSVMHSELSLRFGAYYYPVKVGDFDISHTLLTIGVIWTFSRNLMKY